MSSVLIMNPEQIVSSSQSDWKSIENTVEQISVKAALTGKANVEEATNANKCFTALAQNCIQTSEAYLVKSLPVMLKAAGHDNANVRKAAVEAIVSLCGKMGPNAVDECLPALFKASDHSQNWRSRVAALNAITTFADSAPEQLCHSLPDTVPAVSESVTDLKKEVAKAATAALTASCEVIGNRDIEHMTAHIVRSVVAPDEVPDIMHKLAGVTFVQSVSSAALAMVTPLLVRGLNPSNKKETIRQSARIIDNMSRLVDDPMHAAPFLRLLTPALEKAKDVMSDPEARNVLEQATEQLNRLIVECAELEKLEKKADAAQVIEFLQTTIGCKDHAAFFAHIAEVALSLMRLHHFQESQFSEVLNLLSVIDADATKANFSKIVSELELMVKPLPPKDNDDDDAEELCNTTFTLAFGTKILLHNTQMKLKRGAKYGLLGGNDSGKTTLMRSIANGSVEGFPDPSTVRTVFVEADILGELSHLSCVDYVMEDPRLKGLSRDEVLEVMNSVGFVEGGKAPPNNPVSSLSGGWRMKLAMARAMLQKADILLLDEPTNHLDVINVKWVKNYINSLTNVTAIMVSHDSGFLNDCCTNIIQINRLKLRQYRGNLNAFIKENPEAKSYFSIKESKLKFKFPQPGPIEGVKSRSKVLMKMKNAYFTYPGNDKPTLFDINVAVSMASRVGCVGENGAGKSTMIKVLTGEVVPQQGEVTTNPNARVAYVAQHAFHHIEQHLDKTPNEYIRWRYQNGEDKEALVKVSLVLTEDEEKLQVTPFELMLPDENGINKKVKKTVEDLLGNRRTNKQKEYEYEVKFKGDKDGVEGTYVQYPVLKKQGWDKACKACDQRLAQLAGMYVRTLSAKTVELHLSDVGLEPEFATHYRMSALSGGQKVKVVIAAALWNQPHILILDEPTNYLDREALGALAGAIEEFEGGVVIISHNNEFVKQLCPEEWVMDAGHLTTKGEAGWMDRQDDKIADQAVITHMIDASGNEKEIKKTKTLSKREEKVMIKKVTAKIAAGEQLDDDEEAFAIEKNL